MAKRQAKMAKQLKLDNMLADKKRRRETPVRSGKIYSQEQQVYIKAQKQSKNKQ